MSEQGIRDYAREKNFHPKTLARWLDWAPLDSDALFEIAGALRPGENHLRDLMDWLEEIALRDETPIHQIVRQETFSHILTDPRLGRADRLKRLKEQVRRLRWPRLAEIEDAIHGRIQDLKLPVPLKVSAPPGLEGGFLRVEFNASSPEELKKLAGCMVEAGGSKPLEEIFQMLAGAMEGHS